VAHSLEYAAVEVLVVTIPVPERSRTWEALDSVERRCQGVRPAKPIRPMSGRWQNDINLISTESHVNTRDPRKQPLGSNRELFDAAPSDPIHYVVREGFSSVKRYVRAQY